MTLSRGTEVAETAAELNVARAGCWQRNCV